MGTCGACPEPIGLAALEYSNNRASSAHSSNRPSNPYSATLVIGAGIVGSKFIDSATDFCGFAFVTAYLLCWVLVPQSYLTCISVAIGPECQILVASAEQR